MIGHAKESVRSLSGDVEEEPKKFIPKDGQPTTEDTQAAQDKHTGNLFASSNRNQFILKDGQPTTEDTQAAQDQHIGNLFVSSSRNQFIPKDGQPTTEDTQAAQDKHTGNLFISSNRNQHSAASIETDSQASEDLRLSQISNWSEEEMDTPLAEANFVINCMSKGNISPLRSQLRTDIKDSSSSSVYYYKKKASESIDSVLNLIAPGRSDQLRELVFGKKPRKEEKENSDSIIINDILKLYEETIDNSLKTQLLSVISTKLSKIELQRLIPGLTKYRIDTARHSSINIHGLTISTKLKQPRRRMDTVKLQHALSFFFDPSFIQTVSYGVRELILDSGEKLAIPDLVRTVCNSKMVDMYVSYCNETDFEPLGRTSLYSILNACAASKRTNLRGLDNITASGIEGFDLLEELLISLRDAGHLSQDTADELKASLASSKLYLKTDFKLHVSESDCCADHCLHWSLSDSTTENLRAICDHIHTLKCDRCEQLNFLQERLESVVTNLVGDLKEDAVKTLSDAFLQIKSWKSHIVRTINQDQFRINLLEKLNENEAILVMDWAMKFLPLKYRQTQTDWFGQRGINWHVTVCIFRDNYGLSHHTYTHVLDGVKQDWYSVMSVLEHCLVQIKAQLPMIQRVYLRSDNAGCYHNGHLWLCLPEVSKRTGIEIAEYCYSEPQAGKSYCDAKIAHMRQKIKTYVASGHDVCTAAEMKEALDAGQGVSGCQVAVIDIDATQQVLKTHKLKNVTSFNDIKFLKDEIEMRKAYGIGTGIKISKKTMCDLSGGLAEQTRAGYIVISDFSLPNKSKGKIGIPQQKKSESDQDHTVVTPQISESEESGIFSCPETSCIKNFGTYRELQQHLLVGKHSFELERETTYDGIKKQWACLCNDVLLTRRSVSSTSEQGTTVSDVLQMGWALKKGKVVSRFSKIVKEFLGKKFEEGEVTGKKANPQEVSKEMRKARTESGERVFPINDCLSAAQINSYFSRLSLVRSQKKVKRDAEEVDSDLMAVLSAIEENTLFEQLQKNE